VTLEPVTTQGVSGDEPALGSGGPVTMVEGSTFCVSGRSGDMDPAAPQGLFYRDTRVLSAWQLQCTEGALQVLAVQVQDPFRAVFVSRVVPEGSQTDLLVERTRYIGEGMREDLRVRNLSAGPVRTTLRLRMAADFADLFEVKESRVRPRGEVSTQPNGNSLTIAYHRDGMHRGVRVVAEGARASRDGLLLDVSLPPRGQWETSVQVHVSVDGEEVAQPFPVGHPVEDSRPAERMRAWRAGSPRVRTADRGLENTLRRSLEDLGGLRISDPAHPEATAVAAGAPWFMALFGRDSLLSSYMALPLDADLALGTLRALARLQGTKVDPDTEEEPGRILHETRLGLDFPLARGGRSVYYGTADATPLFVTLLGELSRWGIAPDAVAELLPHADRALEWISDYGDRDGDGFVEYHRMTDQGLINQGWKDSFDGINFADGTLAHSPIALAEVQAYVYSAYLARAHLAYDAGDEAAVERWTRRAGDLKAAFNERFWLADRGWFAVGLDPDKRPIDALASNMGHCLWTGLVDEDKAAHVADHLLSPEMFSGWGVRTLATSMGAYNPMSYHNGSVWPHENALIITGLLRYGFVEHAQRVAEGILDAAAAFDGRLPELFCGFDRAEFPSPLPYPTSCSPQAWASAAPIQIVRALLRIDPCMSHRRVFFDPAWPARYGTLTVRNLALGSGRLSISIDGGEPRLEGVPDDVEVLLRPRPALSSLVREGGADARR
jgi:glycogen debranching enzyme